MNNNIFYGLSVFVTTISFGYCSNKIYEGKLLYMNQIDKLNSTVLKISTENSLLKSDNDLLLQFVKNKNLNIEYDEFVKNHKDKKKKSNEMNNSDKWCGSNLTFQITYF